MRRTGWNYRAGREGEIGVHTDRKKVVVLLPTYNEREVLERFVGQVLGQQCELDGHDLQVLIVDSHSPDGTAALARQLAERDSRISVLEVPQRGLGMALYEGYRHSLAELQPDVLAQIDADGQAGVEVLPRLLRAIDGGCDLALGSRFVEGGRNELPLHRRLFSIGSSMVFRALSGQRAAREVTNMARAFTPALYQRMATDRLPWKERSFIVLPAFLDEALKAGASCREVPLVFKDRAQGYSKNQVLGYIYDMLAYCLDARLRRMGLGIPLFSWSRKLRRDYS